MMSRSARWSMIGALALFGGCGGGSSDQPGASSGNAGAEIVEDEGHIGVLGDEQDAPAFPSRPIAAVGGSELTGILVARSAEAPPPGTQQLYRRVAPATVIVRTPESMGTGVLVGPGGLVLTNNHVIQGAIRENFRQRVDIEYGQLAESGSMVPEGRRRHAWVLKTDPGRDMALLRVEDPMDAPMIALASADPSPGMGVTCVGHGNVGMVWAVRTCQVEATGRLEETYARMIAVCGGGEEASEDPSVPAYRRRSRQRMRERMCERLRRDVSRMTGMVVQTSCVIAPGDSGGPLVDGEGLLVGLNVLSLRNERNQRSNFHIHGREIRDFLRSVPDEPEQDIPDPWMDDIQSSRAIDQDLDGRMDTILLTGERREMVRLFDLDQDSQDFPLDQVEQVIAQRRFDAEVAMVSHNRRNYVWYDTDNDGHMELLLSLRGYSRVAEAHVITADGEVTEDEERGEGRAIDSSRLPASMRTRFDRLVHRSSRVRMSGAPSPLPGLLRRGHLVDSNNDRVFDTLRGDDVLIHALAFDVDQNSLRQAQQSEVDALVRDGRLDAEVSVLRRGDTMWAFYDVDNNGQIELGFRSARSSSVVVEVVPVEGQAAVSDPDQYVGTMMFRTEWAGSNASAFEHMLASHVPSPWIAGEHAQGGLPDPMAHHVNPNIRTTYSSRGWNNAVVAMMSPGFNSTLVDVDRSSFSGREGRGHLSGGLEQAVRDGHYHPNFAMVATQGALWAWYDTDLDDTWDVVLARVSDRGNLVRNGFRRGSNGQWSRDASLVQGPLVRSSLFPSAQRRRFQTLVLEMFEPGEVEGAPDPTTRRSEQRTRRGRGSGGGRPSRGRSRSSE